MPKTSAAQLKANAEYKKKHTKQIIIQATIADAATWDAYAAALDLPRATMIRRAVAASMAADGWTPSTPSERATDATTAAPEEVQQD